MNKELPEDILKILACPICRSKLEYKKDKNILRCNRCKINYPIKEGIPILTASKKKE